MSTSDTTPSIISWFNYLTPIATFIGAMLGAAWVSGYKIGQLRATLQRDLGTMQKDVTVLTNAVNELADIDCVEEEEIKNAGYLTRKDLEREQDICRRDREHKAELFSQQMLSLNTHLLDNTATVKSMLLELKCIREALIKKGIIE